MSRLLEPLPGAPALRIGGKSACVIVADIHLGLGEELEEAGFNAKRNAVEMEEMLLRLSEIENRLVILGDLRHTVGFVRRSEVPAFLSALLRSYERIDIVPGNHDALIARGLPQRVILHSSDGFVEDGNAFIHGHTWPPVELMEADTLIMGHLHPAIAFKDSLGNTYIEKCWLRIPFRKTDASGRYPKLPTELIVLPAFNPLLSGTPVNRKEYTPLGPLLKSDLVRMEKGKVYLLDGTYLGTVGMNAY
ncbi:MAG: metallophosphoesterase [Methanomassiliicoccales archaeon]